MRVLLLAASAYALDALHALLDSHPRGLRKVAVAHTSYGRGLVATCAVAKDEACLRIPYELCAVEPEASADVGHLASRMWGIQQFAGLYAACSIKTFPQETFGYYEHVA